MVWSKVVYDSGLRLMTMIDWLDNNDAFHTLAHSHRHNKGRDP
jgi:hypothetical protein